MLALMTNIIQFAYWKCAKKKKEKHWDKWGPVYILMIATLLVLIQPVCMLVIGSWDDFSPDTQANLDDLIDDDSVATYLKDNGISAVNCGEPLDDAIANFFFVGDDTDALVPNTTVGWMIQIFGTYLGFIFLFWGVIWATNLHNKIAKKWRIIRGKQQATQAPVAEPVATASATMA